MTKNIILNSCILDSYSVIVYHMKNTLLKISSMWEIQEKISVCFCLMYLLTESPNHSPHSGLNLCIYIYEKVTFSLRREQKLYEF